MHSIQIVKKWRGVANADEEGAIAVRTSSEMSRCVWQHEDAEDDDEIYE